MIIDEKTTGKIPMENLLKLQAIYPSLKKAEHKAADLILENPDFIVNATISEVAQLAGCSEPTFVRLAKKMGLEGFAELKMILRNMKSSDDLQNREYGNIRPDDCMEEITRKVFESCINAVSDTLKLFDAKAAQCAIDVLNKARSVLFVGIGDSYRVADLAKGKFQRIGMLCFATNDVDEMLMQISMMDQNDVVVLISHSGQTIPVVRASKAARSANIPTIAITNFPFSHLGRNSDILLLTSAFQESINGEIMAKRVSQLAIIESIYVNVFVKNPKRVSVLQKSDSSVSINKM